MGSLLSIISRVFNTLCNVFKRNSIAVESSHCNRCNAKTCVDNDNALRNSVNTSERDFAVNKEKRIGSKVTNRKPTMDVTKHNFLEVLDLIDSVIAECDFIAIDTELTGLKRSDVKTLQVLDTIDDRYVKLRDQISCFNLIQFGLSCFKVVDDNGDVAKYECNSYNFYIFPQKSSVNKAMGERVFSVQTSSLQFLVNNGFDFNKLIIDGISYLNVSEEKVCRETIKSQNEVKQAIDKSPVSATSATTEEDKQFVVDVIAKVTDFMADDERQTLDLSPCNAFKRRLIYESLKSQNFNDSIEIKTVPVSQNSYDRYISVSKMDKLEKERKDEEALTEAIGFSNVVKLIIKYEKPIVGHNLLLDLMHTFNQFIEPLPNDYKGFKESIHSLFPLVYDTKHIASSTVFKDHLENTTLGDLYERLKKSPFKAPEVVLKNGKHLDGRALHEAGYDSYLTGICFIGLSAYLGSRVTPKVNKFDRILLKGFQNRLHLTFTHDIHYLNMEEDEPAPNRDHVFHITFPKEWKTNELFHLFSAFGGVSIHWLNDSSAFCALRDSSNTLKIMKSLVKNSSTTYKVIPYNDFINKTKNGKQQDNETRVEVKRNSKSRSSPQPTNPNKKTKIMSNEKKTRSKTMANKLFEEPKEWPLE